ncbi:MAG: hypothetical protein JWP13_205 [Candidatus Saccharibacteria bacterium]|nr:hypothetical protein [Candidatus Saccharibacteria bacterium]
MDGLIDTIRFPQMTDEYTWSKGPSEAAGYIRRISTPVPLTRTEYSTRMARLSAQLGQEVTLPPEPEVQQLINNLEGTPGVTAVTIAPDGVWLTHDRETDLLAFEEHKSEIFYAIGSLAAASDGRIWTAGVTTPDGYRITD